MGSRNEGNTRKIVRADDKYHVMNQERTSPADVAAMISASGLFVIRQSRGGKTQVIMIEENFPAAHCTCT